MKRFMAVAVLSMSLLSTPASAYVHLSVPVWMQNIFFGIETNVSNKTALTVAALGASAAGTWYILNCIPSWRFSSAQKTYNSLDNRLIKFLDVMNKEADLDAYAARLFPCSGHPLVTVFNEMCSAYNSTKAAIESLDKAIDWSKDVLFINVCTQLQNKLKNRLEPFEAAMSLLRAQHAWSQQYALYLQECSNERLARLETAIWIHGCRTN